MAGKKVGKFVTVSIDDSGGTARVVSTDVTGVGGLNLAYAKIDAGGYTEDLNFLTGRGDSEITIDGIINDTASTGLHTVCSGIVGGNTARTVTIAIGDNATVTTGDPEFEGEFLCHTYTVTPDLNGAVTVQAIFAPAVGQSLPAWGTVA